MQLKIIKDKHLEYKATLNLKGHERNRWSLFGFQEIML